ncbi:MAG: DUF1553 domain-containing protein [Verrucomicrobiales bacterium]|nr:DUF1553 domain-containing protein [Verrucomicrobiales bacterium]
MALLALALPAYAQEKQIDFNRDIRPILSDKCYQCHGPDEETLEADLRLDLRESAVTGQDGAAIVPGNPDASELIYRITADDDLDIMPPPKIKKPVTAEEAALLKQWIAEGAEYEDHWSFQPIENPEPPAVKNGKWPKNGIDPFVLAQLETEKIEPSPMASPHTLIRRMSLDLTGLLPDPKRVESFVSEFKTDADAAVKKLADELLASPHYGERWGRHWLDQARYADSHGYTIDGERTMWPFRDWVIRQVNADMPFDQFTIEQLAGDLLEKPTKSQLVASGFHRNTLINQEGGTDDEQFRNEEVVDRVNTTGAVWLGLTLGCAQCHTHKFDPITQKEYFELFAFFNQQTDVNNAGQTVEVAEGELFLDDADPAKLSAYEEAKKAVASLNASKAKRQVEWEKVALAARTKTESDEGPGADWKPIKPAKFSATSAELKLLEDNSILASILNQSQVYTVELPAPAEPVAAIRLRLLNDKSLPKNGPGIASNGNIVLTRIEFRQNGKRLAVVKAQDDHSQPGFSSAFTIDDDPKTGWAINVGKGSAPGAKMNAPHEAHYFFAEEIKPEEGPIEVRMHHELHPNYNIGRFAFDVSKTVPKPISTDKLFTVLQKPEKERSGDDKKFLTAEFAKNDVELKKANAKLNEAKTGLGFGKEVRTMVMRDLPTENYRATYIHERGDFLRKDEETGKLLPAPLSIFPKMVKAETPAERTRMDLANWLVDPENPLTARVTVNRVWMRYFGRGIVETENDFGTQGTYPTHPELLDWLATKFVEGGWSMKNLHRLIVTSATYRQSSNIRPDLKEIDALNHLLARQNRIRFDAEIVRDAALSASGLLTPKLGGPGVTPPQPDGVYAFTQSKKTWNVPDGPERYRRAMYVKFIRSAPYPLLTTFDSPDFQSVCTARIRSNTPLQSLTLANDEALFELAQGLAARMMREVSGTDSVANRNRIRHGVLLSYARKASESEIDLLAKFQEQQSAAFQADPEGAKAVAPKEIPEGFDAAQAASWTTVARALMNTDEFITRE